MINTRWSEDEIEILKSKYSTMSITDIIKYLPAHSLYAIQRKACSLGIYKTQSKAVSLEEKFLKNVDYDFTSFYGDDPCIIWKGDLSHNGYGQFIYKGKHYRAHIYSYIRQYGPIPIGLVIDHLCRNRQCVNPDHLEAVTIKENILRGDGIAAKNAIKTHCQRGHQFTLKNTYTYPNGHRECRTCRKTLHK